MIKKQLIYPIEACSQGQTVEAFLKEKGYSRHLLIHLRRTPMGLTIGGQLVYTTHRLKEGEELTVSLVEEENSHNIVPVELPLKIVYEDQDILVVNKDAGVPIHPSQGHFYDTLANRVAWYFQKKGEPMIYRVMNRLDRDTTGLLILAKHMLSACILSDQMVKRQIHREYRAVVQGLTDDSGTICRPIGRVDGSTIQRQIDELNGEYACTHYQRISYNEENDLSYISLRLETGRTHQIRVHMASIGHPLPGDFLYNPDYSRISRQPLHSHRLSFIHPITGLPMELTAELPEDMACLL